MTTSRPVHIPQCRHIRASGLRCGSPALRGKSHCHYYALHLRADSGNSAPLPFPEDAASLQLALHQVIRGLLNGQWDRKQAALLLYALQIAQSNIKLLRRESDAAEFALRDKAVRDNDARDNAQRYPGRSTKAECFSMSPRAEHAPDHRDLAGVIDGVLHNAVQHG